MLLKNTIFVFTVITFIACSSTKMKVEIKLIDVQGHRGCRGLLPENTIEAFDKALELGVTTLEMDLVISSDKQVVVSHEPFFNHEISTGPNNSLITKENQLEHNVYKLTYEEIMTYDVGLKATERFPDQKKQSAIKPLFKEVVKRAEAYAKELNRAQPYYNVEIKRKPDADHTYHPDGEEFARLVVNEVQSSGVKDRIYIQSFDVESLQEVQKLDKTIKLVLLIENRDSPEKNLEKLGFTPDVYSPYYLLVNQELVSLCKSKNMQLIPWTVNKTDDLNKMLTIGVDGIITDYPNLLIDLIGNSKQYDILY